MNDSTIDDELEGLDSHDEDASFGDYPIDTLLIRNENRTVHDVLRRIDKNSFVMDPDFQRDFIWPEDKQSKLIESVLMRIPLPVFYLAENYEGKMIVVDGLQRLSTFQRFVKNNLKLKLPKQKDLHNKRFEDLSPKLQNRVEDCNLVLYVIDSKVPDQALLDIFDRVNSGVALSRQQMRNCLYTGPATRFLKAESHEEIFLEATGGSLNPKTMRDRELINRFCAFEILGVDDYKGDMDDFLAQSLREMNNFSDGQLKELSTRFRRGLTNNLTVFGRHAFRKHRAGQDNRSVINASLWDVMSTSLARYREESVSGRLSALREAFYDLFEDEEFLASISLGTNQVSRVKYRFGCTDEVLREVMDD